MNDELSRSQRAEVLRHSPRAEDREESERIFRELRGSAQTGVAYLAMELAGDAMYEKPRRGNPALTAMSAAWMGLRSPMHPNELDSRFEPWFAKAERHPDLLDEFAPTMVASASDWLGEYERNTGVTTADAKRSRANFEAWAMLASRFPAVGAALSDIRARLDEIRAQYAIEEMRSNVVAAIADGDPNAAENYLNDTRGIHRVPDALLDELNASIEDLRAREKDCEAWWSELAAAPASWRDAIRLVELRARGRAIAQIDGTPADWIARIRLTLDQLQAYVDEFISKRAAGCLSLDDLRSEIAAIRKASAKQGAILDETWLAPLVARLVALLEPAIEAARDSAALRRIDADALAIIGKLLPSGGRAMHEARQRIAAIVAAWDGLASDDIPAALPAGSLPLRFEQQFETARLLSSRVVAADEMMQRGSTTADRIAACRDAIAILEGVLVDAPHHARATALHERVVARLEALQLDDRIERWEIAELRHALVSVQRVEPPYASLASAIGVLEELAALRREKPITGLQIIVRWWRTWSEHEAKLPEQMPDVLRSTLELVHREVVTVLRAACNDYLERTTTIDDDRDAEAAIAEVAPALHLRDEWQTLSRRRTIHAAVLAARARGGSALAVLLRDSWVTIERFLPWSGRIFAEAFEHAWDTANEEALDALRDVALHLRQARANDERFRCWLDWLDVERALAASVSPELLRRMQSLLQRDDSGAVLVRRLAHVVEKWRSDGDDAVLVWASRAFAHLDPPLFPGLDPLVALQRRTESEVDAILRAFRNAAVFDAKFADETAAALQPTEEVWQRLERLLLDVPVPPRSDAWPAPPGALVDARELLRAIRRVVEKIARWKYSDLRTAGSDLDEMRRVLLLRLAEFPATEELVRVMRKVEPLTRLTGLQEFFQDECRNCKSEAPADARHFDLFLKAAQKLDPIIDSLRVAEPEGTHTTHVIDGEYWDVVPQLCGDLLPRDDQGDLATLRRRLIVLQDNDVLFANAIKMLWQDQPNIGAAGEFDPEAHRDYIAHYPAVPPASLRVKRRFDEFAARSAQRVILRASRALLPEWLQRYIDDISRGVAP